MISYPAETARAVLLIVAVLGLAAGPAAIPGGAASAGGGNTTATIHELTGANVSNVENVTAGPETDVAINYTAETEAGVIVESASLRFEDVVDGSTVERDLPGHAVTGRNETVEVPAAEGYYNVTLTVVDENGDTAVHVLEQFLIVHTTEPSVDITSPANGSSHVSPPRIEGTAFDGAGIENVTLRIANGDGNYWNGSAWVSEETWVVAADPTVATGEQVEWEYYFEDEGVEAGGVYTVTANAHDGFGNDVSDPAVPSPGVTRQITVEYVASPPAITGFTADASEPVHDGDTIDLRVTVEERGANAVGAVWVTAESLGIERTNLTTTDDAGPYDYTGTVTLDDPTAASGDVTLTATAREPTEQLTTEDTAAVELQRTPATVSGFEVGPEFLGVVEDGRDSVGVTASGIEDAQGRPLTRNVTLAVGGGTWELPVRDGELYATIDPEEIPDDAAREDAVAVRADGETVATFEQELVHRAYGLPEGYQPVGTPMDARKVLVDPGPPGNEAAMSIETYDPVTEEWEEVSSSSELAAAGTAYYVYASNSNATIGFEFETTGSDGTRERDLSAGYNLVGASVRLHEDTGENLTIASDLAHGQAVTIDGGTVTAYTPDAEGRDLVVVDSDQADLNWSSTDDFSEPVGAFAGYWVEIDDGYELVREFKTAVYDPEADEPGDT